MKSGSVATRRHVLKAGAALALGTASFAALGIAVVGPEGASVEAVQSANVVCRSILEALDLLLDERALIATLRR